MIGYNIQYGGFFRTWKEPHMQVYASRAILPRISAFIRPEDISGEPAAKIVVISPPGQNII